MKANIKTSLKDNTLIMTKTFYKKASVCGSDEYYELRKAMAENVGFAIAFKAADKKTYNRLTLEVMADYIKTQPNSKERLIEFAAVQAVAETKNAKYPLTKKWFFEKYPEYKICGVQGSETETLIAEMAKKIAEAKMENVADMLANASNQ